jgi:hypothetical protein
MKRRILNFESFLLESNKANTINEQIDLNAIPSSELQAIIDTDMKSYLKRAMWNKSIEVFYGKDYKGNPTEDKREVFVGDWFESHDRATMGEFFQDAWAETDQFCDRVVEYVETGKISDTWGDIATVVGWSGIAAASVAAILATGGAIIPGLTASSAFVVASGAAAGTAAWGVTAVNVAAAMGLASAATNEINKAENQNLNPELINVANMINDKDTTIKNFKSSIEGYWTDFEADWGLDRWLPGVQGMPGWNSSSWAKAGAENIGYSFTYWISYYAYQYLKVKFGATIAQTIKETPVTTPTTTPSKTATKSVQAKADTTTAPTTPSTTSAPSGGVMGASQPKQYNINVDDSTVANYDL